MTSSSSESLPTSSSQQQGSQPNSNLAPAGGDDTADPGLPTAPPRLNALRGSPAPPLLADDLRQLLTLPQRARDEFWQLLEMHLQDSLSDDLGRVSERFANAFGVATESLVRLVRGCRLLIRSAAAIDLAFDQFTIDLNLLCGEHPEVTKAIADWYRKALPRIRGQETLDKLPAFGPILQDVQVLKSFAPTSRHTPDVITPLMSMTLGYVDGGEQKRLTLQLTPRVLEMLQRRCDELAG